MTSASNFAQKYALKEIYKHFNGTDNINRMEDGYFRPNLI